MTSKKINNNKNSLYNFPRKKLHYANKMIQKNPNNLQKNVIILHPICPFCSSKWRSLSIQTSIISEKKEKKMW